MAKAMGNGPDHERMKGSERREDFFFSGFELGGVGSETSADGFCRADRRAW